LILGNVNAPEARDFPSRPAVVAAAYFSGKNSLAGEEWRGESAAKDFRQM
jgi:hypothetical protein